MRSTSASDLDLIEARGDGGGGGTPYIDLYREAPPERGVFFRLQVSMKGHRGFSSWSISKGREICHLGLGKGPKWLTDELYFKAL